MIQSCICETKIEMMKDPLIERVETAKLIVENLFALYDLLKKMVTSVRREQFSNFIFNGV
jgi:hypothetical protein